MLNRLVNFRGGRALAVAVGVGFMGMVNAPAQAAIEELVGAFTVTTQTDADTSFNFFIAKPITPLSGQYLLTFTLQGTLTDSARNNGVSLEFVAPTTSIGEAYFNNNPPPAILNLGEETTSIGAYGLYSASTIVDATNFGGTISTLNMRIHLRLSGGGDSFAFEGKMTLDEVPVVPVPPAAGMGMVVLGGMAGAAFLRRRRVAKE